MSSLSTPPPSSLTASSAQATASAPLTVDNGETLDQRINKFYVKALLYFFSAIFLVVIGALFAVIYDLEARVYEAVGKQSVSNEIYTYKVEELNEENKKLKNELFQYKCLENPKIKNKGECYRYEY